MIHLQNRTKTMLMKTTPLLDDTTIFENVRLLGRGTNGVYIILKSNEIVRCQCIKKTQKATIFFDLFTRACNHDLSKEVQERLYYNHLTYIDEHFTSAGHTINSIFSGNLIFFDVLTKDAEEWFRKIITLLNDASNLQPST